MMLSIIPSDGTVVKDGIGYTGLIWDETPPDVHALQWFGSDGWIEFIGAEKNIEIDILPEWVQNAIVAWEIANTPKPILPPTKEQNKLKAIHLLYQTDWTVTSDVSNQLKSSPYLSNVDDFIEYRNKIRHIVFNPTDGEIDWPTKPSSVWK